MLSDLAAFDILVSPGEQRIAGRRLDEVSRTAGRAVIARATFAHVDRGMPS